MANDLQQVGARALGRAPQPLRRALDRLGIQFKQENGPTQAMANGHQYGNIAGVAQRDPNTISVMQPDVFRKNADQLVTHEGVHSWQNNLPPSIQNAIPPDNPNDPYNFGGTEGVKSVLAKGGTLANMPREQAAAAMQYGQAQGMPEPYRKLANTINDVPLSQIEQTSPDQRGINMKPRAPQVPPASVPGMNYAAATYKPGDPAPGDMTASMLGPMPDLGQPQAPQATYAPSPQQQNIDNDQQQLQKVRFAQANPWGTANNHPGTMGKIAHVLSVAGNIAGNIVAPNIMANIPGTQMNMNVREHGLQNQLDQETGELSQNQARDAGTQATQLANAAEPQKALDQHGLVQSEIGKNEQDKVPQPMDLAHAYSVAVQRAIAAGQDPTKDPVVQHLSDAIVSIQPGQNKADSAPKTIAVVPPGQSKPHEMAWDPKTNKYDLDQGEHYEKPQVVNVNAGRAQDRAQRNDVMKAYQPTLDSAERMNVMTESYEKAIKDHDQQAMLNLLANHLGMTMGLQKGARLTKDIINEAKQSQPWLQGIQSKFDKDGYLAGVTLSPNQMRQMVSLGQSRYAEDAKKSRSQAQYMGAEDDGPERVPGKSTINYYLGLAHGDPKQAKQLAAQDGWSVK